MTATATPETAKILADLIQQAMVLSDEQVTIYNQKFRIPGDKGLHVNVAIIGDRPFAVNTRYSDPGDPAAALDETATINQQEIVQVDVYSYDSSARLRRIEIIFALASTAAQQLAELYGFQIGRIPTNFVDVSEVEASKRLNRYALTFNVLRAYERTIPAPTFAEFGQPQLYTNP